MAGKEIDKNTKVWDIPGFAGISEYPFVHDDLTWGEYEVEKKYFIEHYQDYRMGNYVPLWKQRENSTK